MWCFYEWGATGAGAPANFDKSIVRPHPPAAITAATNKYTSIYIPLERLLRRFQTFLTTTFIRVSISLVELNHIAISHMIIRYNLKINQYITT